MRPPSSSGCWGLRRFAPLVLAATGLLGCSDDAGPAGPADGTIAAQTEAGAPSSADAGAADLFTEIENPETDQPLVGLPRAALDVFNKGDRLFGTVFREPDGLGPLYIRPSCAACHQGAGSGPGLVEKFQVVDATTGAPIMNAPELIYGGTERPFAVAGAQPLLAPASALPGHQLVHSRRIGPTVMGRGYIEAVLDSEIERVAAEQAGRTDGIHGRINRVTYHSQSIAGVAVPHEYGQTGVIGRFGVKARVATLDDFTADAFQGDMGLTSPLRPAELPNPDGVQDDARPGPDLTAELVTTVAAYVRTIEIPSRAGAASTAAGAAAFVAADCAVCHVTGLNTRPDFPVPQLAGIYAPLYSDLLLHDMGEDLADRQTDESAGPRDWRTAPLIALRFQGAYLHDGRAATIEVAILKHAGAGSEANGAVAKFKALPPEARAALLAFVHGL
jgi:CxxC motif-containing protein (DUF1111 family)